MRVFCDHSPPSILNSHLSMALTLPILPPNPNSIPSPLSFSSSSFLPFKTLTLIPITTTRTRSRPPLTIITSSSKLTRFPSLDRHATSHNNLRFVRKLTTLLLSKPRHYLPLKILARCRHYLSLPPNRPLLQMLSRYPSIFTLSHLPSYSSSSLSLLCVSLTPSALSLFSHLSLLRSQISSSLAANLHRLLLLSSHPRLLLSKLVHIAPDLGLPPNFRSRLCNSHPHLFRTIHTSYGRALELTPSPPHLPVLPFPPIQPRDDHRKRPIIDRPAKFKFKQVKLRKGLNLKRKHLDYLIRFQEEVPEINPYSRKLEEGMSAEEKEKRACTVVREVLGMTVEKRTLVDHLTHFRKEFGLPNKLRAMLVRHPEMFYVSVKGQRDSVFLVEAYDEKGRLLVEDELLVAKARLEELVREGKRMRRERRRGVGLMGDGKDDDDDEVEEGEDFDDDDGFGDLFESGIGEDWEEFDGGGDGGYDDGEDVKEIVEFWSMKGEGESRSGDGEGSVEAW